MVKTGKHYRYAASWFFQLRNSNVYSWSNANNDLRWRNSPLLSLFYTGHLVSVRFTWLWISIFLPLSVKETRKNWPWDNPEYHFVLSFFLSWWSQLLLVHCLRKIWFSNILQKLINEIIASLSIFSIFPDECQLFY